MTTQIEYKSKCKPGTFCKISDIKKCRMPLYIFYADNLFIASTRRSDVDDFLKEMDVYTTLRETFNEEVMSVYGVAVDAEKIPISIPKEYKDYTFWILTETEQYPGITYVNADFQEYQTVEELVVAIENMFLCKYIDSIDDIIVIFGCKMDLVVKMGNVDVWVDPKKL